MSIEGITPAMSSMHMSGASPIAGGRYEGQLQGALGDVADMLGMTPQQLNAGLNAGENLSKLTGTRLDNIAQRIAHHRHLHVRAAASGPTATTPTDWTATAPPAL